MILRKIFSAILMIVFLLINVGAIEETDAINIAVQKFAIDNNLPTTDVKVLDMSIYNGEFSKKKWFLVKLGSKNKQGLINVDSDNKVATNGWDSIEQTEKQKKVAISPILSSILENKSLNDVTVVIVLKNQPKIREIVKKVEGKYSEELIDSLNNNDKGKIKKIVSKVKKSVINESIDYNVANGQNNVVQYLKSINADILNIGSVRNHVVAKVATREIDNIAKLSDVDTIEPMFESSANLDISTQAINANLVWPYVQGNSWVSSAGFINEVSIFDSGVDGSHPALPLSGNWNYVPSYESTADDLQGHGTHVAGIVGSRDATLRGVAPGVALLNEKVAYRTSDGRASSPWTSVFSALSHSYDYVSEIVQYSYGWYPPSSGYDYYTNANGNKEISRTFDAYVEAGLLSIIAAGNDGSAFDTIGVPGDAYNVITVGNFDDRGTVARTDDIISASSSRGYTGDGRTKPDVAAPGRNINSANYNWEGLNPDFVEYSGTSMAAPHVSGLAALLIDQWAYLYSERLSGTGFVYGGPLSIRAMIYNSADESTGESSGSINDRITGAGYIEANLTYQQATKNRVKILNLPGEYNETITVNPGETVKATIVWNRHVDLATKTAKSISDVDLELLDSAGNILIGSYDAQTNWEKVSYRYTGTSPTTLRIRVYPFNIPSDIGTETVVLAYSGAAGDINNPPNLPTSLTQFKSDGVTGIPIGGITTETTVVAKGVVSDPNNDPVQLEVEVKPVGTAFSNTPTCTSGSVVASGSTASATCSGLPDGQYHWQARAKDDHGDTGTWVSAGGNPESSHDFIVDTPTQPATVFVRGSDMGVWYNNGSGSSWNGWQSLGGYAISNISSVTLGSDTYIFVNGSDQGVWYNKRTGTSWGGWQSLGGIATSNPGAAFSGSDLYVFVRGSDYKLWYKKLSGGTWTPDWTSLEGYVTSNPDAELLNGELYVFVLGSDYAIWYKRLSGSTFTGWTSLGGNGTSDPDASPNDVFVRGSDMGMWYNRLNGGSFTGWTSLEGFVTSNPDAISNDVFVRGSDYALWHNTWGGSSWSGWQSLEGYATSDPKAVVSGSSTYVFVRGSDNALWYKTLTGSTWTPWASLGGDVTSSPSAVPN